MILFTHHKITMKANFLFYETASQHVPGGKKDKLILERHTYFWPSCFADDPQ